MRSGIIQIVASNNYDIFQHLSIIIFNKLSFHYYFKDYLMTKTDARVNYEKYEGEELKTVIIIACYNLNNFTPHKMIS
jgi:hypothetical protein